MSLPPTHLSERRLARGHGTGPVRSGTLATFGRVMKGVAPQIQGSLDDLQRYARLLPHQFLHGGPPHDTLLTEMHDGVVRLSSLAENLVTFSTENRLRRRLCFLQDIVEQAVAVAQPEIRRYGVRISHLHPEPLPAVTLDAVLLKTAFVNILRSTALTMSEGSELTVVVRSRGDDSLSQQVRFESRSTSFPGVPAPGLGGSPAVGLVLAHRIVRAHGGNIQMSTRSNGESAVIVSVPVYPTSRRQTPDRRGPGDLRADAP